VTLCSYYPATHRTKPHQAPLASPTLTGTPAAPTAAGGTSTTQIATTAFVGGEVTTHAGATDPHGDRSFATSAVSTHNGVTTAHGISAYGATLVNDADAATARSTLGLGSASVESAASFAATSHAHAAADTTSGTFDPARLPAATETAQGAVELATTSEATTGTDTTRAVTAAGVKAVADTKQATLVSGTNIKTVNSTSLLGSGDIAISASPGGSTTQLQYNNAGAFGGMSGTAWDDTNRALTITGATVTTSKPIFDLSQTWNGSGVTMTGWKINITDTASAAGSLLFDGRVGGNSRVRFSKAGEMSVSTTNQSSDYAKVVAGSGAGYFQVKLSNGNISRAYADADGQWLFDNGSNLGGLHIFNTTGTRVNSTAYIGWTDGAAYNGTADVRMFRDAAAVLNLRNSTTAQTLRVSGTYTDINNRVNAALSATSTTVTLAAETAGTGADDVPVRITPAGVSQVEIGNGVQFTEMTAPSAQEASKVISLAQDNGAGKTQLMARFATGAAQQVAIEP